MTLPKITIITPSFNQGQYIEQTITSILDQDYPNLEYIIIDAGSTDETVDIIKKYEHRITYWVSEPDNGQAHAINKGLEKTTGDLVNWINSDDYLEPGALHALAKAYQKYPKGEVFCGYTHCFWDEDGATSHTYRMGIKKDPTNTLLHVEMNQPGSFYKTSVIKELGGINESLRYVFDNELWMRYLCKYGQQNVILLNSLISHFRQHGGSKSFGEGFNAFNKEHQNILQQLTHQTGINTELQSCINNDTEVYHYQTKQWNTQALNKEKFHAWFANKYMTTLLNNGYIQASKIAMFMAFRGRYIRYNRKTLGLFRKLLLRV
jgi:glycosyltransferase involved in cell wall biosynthesis